MYLLTSILREGKRIEDFQQRTLRAKCLGGDNNNVIILRQVCKALCLAERHPVVENFWNNFSLLPGYVGQNQDLTQKIADHTLVH